MTLAEIRTMKQSCRAKIEDFLGRTASRDLSTEENQMFNDLKVEGERLASLESRYAVLESFDKTLAATAPAFTAPAPAVVTPKTTYVGKGRLARAMASATQAERAEVEAFAHYIGGDKKALADLTPSGDGGVFLPSLVANVIARDYQALTPVRDVATVWATDNGNPTTFPVISDSEDAVILSAAADTGADDEVTGDHPPTDITGPTLGAFKFSSKPVFVPRELLTDSGLSILDETLSALLARIARTQNTKFTSGTGTNEPTGFMTTATAFSAGATTTVLDLDIALDLAYSVPVLYRAGASYMMSDTTAKWLRKLKTGLSGDKRQLWADADATKGTPATLHGYPVVINNAMSSVTTTGTFAGVSPVAFGDFRRFVIRDAERGVPYVYRYSVPAKDGSAVLALQRSDSKLTVPVAISKVTVS